MKRITDPGFKYTPSYDTDIKKRFERMKRQKAKDTPAPTPPNVTTIKRKTAA